MKRLLILLIAVLALASACHNPPIWFADGSYAWQVANHQGSGDHEAYVTVGCSNFNRGEAPIPVENNACRENTSLGVVYGMACAVVSPSTPGSCTGSDEHIGQTPQSQNCPNNHVADPTKPAVCHSFNHTTGRWTYATTNYDGWEYGDPPRVFQGCADTNSLPFQVDWWLCS